MRQEVERGLAGGFGGARIEKGSVQWLHDDRGRGGSDPGDERGGDTEGEEVREGGEGAGDCFEVS